MAEQFEVAGAHQAVDLVVLDHQHRQRPQRDAGRGAVVFSGGGQAVGDREIQGEAHAGALAEPALQGDLAAHRLHQALADRQPQAGAAVVAVGGVLDLEEGLEHLGGLVGRDADAGVADREAEPGLALGGGRGGDADGDRALVGELDGVADDVEEELVELAPVADHPPRHRGRHVADEGDTLALGLHRLQRQHVVDGLAQVEGFALQVELAGLDAREAQHVLEDLQQRQVGVADHVEVLALAPVEGALAEQAHGAEHAAEGGAQLVAEGAEEHALGLVGLLGGLAGHGVLGHFAGEQRVAAFEFGGAFGDLALEHLLVAPQLVLEAQPLAGVLAELFEGAPEGGQRVLVAGGDGDVVVAGAERADGGLHAVQAAQQVVAEDCPHGDDQREEQQPRHRDEEDQPAIDGPPGLGAGGTHGLAAGADQLAGLAVEFAPQLVAPGPQLAQGVLDLQALAVGAEGVVDVFARQVVVVRQAELALAGVAQVVDAPLEGREAGGEGLVELIHAFGAGLGLDLGQQRLQLEAQELELGHPLHAVDVHFDQPVEGLEEPGRLAPAVQQPVEVGDVGGGGGRGVRHQGFGRVLQGLQALAAAHHRGALGLLGVEAAQGLGGLLAEVVGDRRDGGAHRGAELRVEALGVELGQGLGHGAELFVEQAADLLCLRAAVDPRQPVDQRADAGVVVGQAPHRVHRGHHPVDDVALGGYDLLEAEPGHQRDGDGQQGRRGEHDQQLADQPRAQVERLEPGKGALGGRAGVNGRDPGACVRLGFCITAPGWAMRGRRIRTGRRFTETLP